MTRIITLANVPGDLQDFVYILLREWLDSNDFPEIRSLISKITVPKPDSISGLQCSMFGIWGSRTMDGSIFTARNLDWMKDSGIQKYKLITVYNPTDGKYSSVTLGYFGFTGALTGMSSQGITVHEANLEEDKITFGGFPWVLRLRYIMENAKNLVEAKKIWEATNNTVGFNHMIGSATDARSLVEETMFNYTAYFFDDDIREQRATYTDPQTGKVEQIGFPMKEAVFRTNHGFDPIIRQNFEWNQSPSSWSMQRYMFISNGFKWYQKAGIKVSYLEAINITAIAADKGSATPYHCSNTTAGSNILSVTYHPSTLQLFAAWEDGTENTWRPACCNTYVQLDMTKWFN